MNIPGLSFNPTLVNEKTKVTWKPVNIIGSGINGSWIDDWTRNRIIFNFSLVLFYSICKKQYTILEKSNNSERFMKIACGKYEITILKIQPVTKHITSFCGVIQFKYSSTKQVSKTGQQNRIQVSEVKNTDCSLKRVIWTQRSTLLSDCATNCQSRS